MRRNKRALIKMGSMFGRRATPSTKGIGLVRKEEALVTHTQTGSAQAESNKSSTTTARKKGKGSEVQAGGRGTRRDKRTKPGKGVLETGMEPRNHTKRPKGGEEQLLPLRKRDRGKRRREAKRKKKGSDPLDTREGDKVWMREKGREPHMALDMMNIVKGTRGCLKVQRNNA